MINTTAFKEKIASLTNPELDSLDMSEPYDIMYQTPERENMLCRSGLEHYRLLFWITQTFSNILITELGVFNGIGTACLCANKTNYVFAFDLDFSTLHFISPPVNVTFNKVDKTKDTEYFSPGIKGCDIIFVDTWHSGIMEKQVFEYLKEKNWNGILIYDDIYFNPAMTEMWKSIDIEKYDLTRIGHSSGTGVVIFDNKKDYIDLWAD